MAKAYGCQTKLNVPYEQVVERVIAAPKVEGFGVLTEIDVKGTLKQKLDAKFRPYTILGACNPHLAQKALHEELEIDLLLPCNIVVYEEDVGSVVSIIDLVIAMDVAENPDVEPIAREAGSRPQRVSAALVA